MKFQQSELRVIDSFAEKATVGIAPNAFLRYAILHKLYIANQRHAVSTLLITSDLTTKAREAGAFLSAIAKTYISDNKKMAFILGGETVVHIKRKGEGGRNQEIVLSALIGLRDTKGAAVFSLGSDGTDGPTDAAGGYADSESYNALLEYGIKAEDALDNNDSYNALKAIDSLIFTGATGTNLNDVSVLLLDSALKCSS